MVILARRAVLVRYSLRTEGVMKRTCKSGSRSGHSGFPAFVGVRCGDLVVVDVKVSKHVVPKLLQLMHMGPAQLPRSALPHARTC